MVAPTKRDSIDVAVRFGKGDQWARANATNTLREKTVTVEATDVLPAVDRSLSFIKALPPKKVDTSLSFIKSLSEPVPTIVNESKQLPKQESRFTELEIALMEGGHELPAAPEVAKPTVIETTVSVSNFKQIIKENAERKPGISVSVNFVEVI